MKNNCKIKGEIYFGITIFTIETFEKFINEIPELKIAEYWISNDVRESLCDKKWLNLILE